MNARFQHGFRLQPLKLRLKRTDEIVSPGADKSDLLGLILRREKLLAATSAPFSRVGSV